ncbi:MAG: glycogen/starch synthase [Patescibacteria group bacterium]|nr:glycogen/starch synthase [Patescibacteria group bacterium]
MKILMLSSELAPFAKVGGLADVMGSLPKAIKKQGADVRLALPLYGNINIKKQKLKRVLSNIKVAGCNVNIWQGKIPNSKVIVYFVECKKYFCKKQVYCDNNQERFLFFSISILQILFLINFKPDIIHCNDYHTALIPSLLKNLDNNFLKETKTILTIHNLQFQGKTKIKNFSNQYLKKYLEQIFSKEKSENINFMVNGILNSNAISTVSKTYAKEITTKKFGEGIENIIKSKKKNLYGVVNGIDVDFFNPQTDKYIKQKYSIKTLNKKTENKVYLQKILGLPIDKNKAIVGLVSRLVWQKGIELFSEKFARLNCQFVFLGTGEKKYEDHLKKIARKYSDKISVNIMFDIKLANQIYAGSDIFLMPSRFEPCGLGQLIAMRYGAVPVARATGGLKDTIENFNFKKAIVKNKKATGFVFNKFSLIAFYRKLNNAINLYYNDKKSWKKIQLNGIKSDFSWDNSAKQYLDLYKKLIK